MADERYPLHRRSEVNVAAEPGRLFAWLDDHRRLAGHMEKPSPVTLGMSMRIETDEGKGQAVGSLICISGRMFGIPLSLEEVVSVRSPPTRKVWETRGEPKLLVIGAYRMGFEISAKGAGSHLVVFIDYRLPERGPTRSLGRLLGHFYAGWCTRRMSADAATAFNARTGA
jgi:hypothetical protein